MHDETAGDEGLGAAGARVERVRADLAGGGGDPVTDGPAPPDPALADPPVSGLGLPAADSAQAEAGRAGSAAPALGTVLDRSKQTGPEPAGLLPESEVFIEIPADRLYVVLARSAAVHLGSVLHLGITDVTDLRLAVDEACALFLLHPAFPDTRDVGLACRFEAYRSELRVTVRAPVPAGFVPDTETIGWIMLGALVDDLAWTRQDGFGTLTLTKRITPQNP